MDGFQFVHREHVRFRDLDGFGHVNNAVYLTYCEQARIGFLAERGLVSRATQSEMSIILARAEIDFRGQVSVGEAVDVGVRTVRVGSKSFELAYELRVGDRLVAEATSVLVGFDYERNTTVTITDEWRRRLTE